MTSSQDISLPRSILVVVPAHDEVQALPACLDALVIARHRSPVPVQIVVVLDRCTDGTAGVVPDGIVTLATDLHNVGGARAAGFAAFGAGCGADVWFACTDADTLVDDSHFVDLCELAGDAHAIIGTVRVRDWGQHDRATALAYEHEYASAVARGHGHVHGANMAVRADAYWAVGGFFPLAVHEDVDLLSRVRGTGYSVTVAPSLCVSTSARTDSRARDGFGSHLLEVRSRVSPAGRPEAGPHVPDVRGRVMTSARVVL